VTYTPAERKLIMSVYDLAIISLAAIMASAWVGEHTNRRSIMKISEACVWPAGLTRFARSVTTGSFGSVGFST